MLQQQYAIERSSNWVPASRRAAANRYGDRTQTKPDPRALGGRTDAELVAGGVRRVDNRRPVVDRYQTATLLAITANGDRATAQWSITDSTDLSKAKSDLAELVLQKYILVASAGVVMAVVDGNGNDYRFLTDPESERTYTIAATALALAKPWDVGVKWLCTRESNGNMRRLSLTEVEFRALYFLVADHYVAANKRNDRLLRDIEQATDVPDLRVIEADIDNGWPS